MTRSRDKGQLVRKLLRALGLVACQPQPAAALPARPPDRRGKPRAARVLPGETVPLERGSEPASFVVAPGFRQSGEPVVLQRRADGTVTSMLTGAGSLARLDPVS